MKRDLAVRKVLKLLLKLSKLSKLWELWELQRAGKSPGILETFFKKRENVKGIYG